MAEALRLSKPRGARAEHGAKKLALVGSSVFGGVDSASGDFDFMTPGRKRRLGLQGDSTQLLLRLEAVPGPIA